MPLALDLATAPLPYVIAPPAASVVWRPVVVRPGDTVWQLALDHGTTPTAIAAKNELAQGGSWIRPGQTILVPVSTDGPASAQRAPSAARATGPRSYTVRAGDTASTIAARHGVTLAALATANRLRDPGLIFPGQRLTIPGSATSTAGAAGGTAAAGAAAGRSVHTVRAGDTLSDIAARHGIGLAKLLAANRLADPGVIHVGQRITIPAARQSKSVSGGTSSAPKPSSANTFAGYTYSDETVAAAAANRRKLAGTAVPNRSQTAAIIRETAIRHGVDPRLALAIAWQESGWNQRAVSVANAVGTMQIMPMSGVWAGQLAGRGLDVLDTRDNITAGVLILRALQSAASSREEAIAGYYQGLHSVRTRGMYADTKAYVSAVLAHRARM